MTKILEGENASFEAGLRRYWQHLIGDRSSRGTHVVVIFVLLGLLGCIGYAVVTNRPRPTPVWYWVLAVATLVRLIGSDNTPRETPYLIGQNVRHDYPLNYIWLVAYRWWVTKMSWAHVIILAATAWAAQTTIDGDAWLSTKCAALLLVALAFIIFMRIDWVAYVKNTPNRLRQSWQLNGALLIASVLLAIVAYVLITGESIPFISWINLAVRLFAGAVLGLTALMCGIVSLKYFMLDLLFGSGVDANPTDVVANQNRDRDADFARVGDTDQALRGWTDYPAEKFED